MEEKFLELTNAVYKVLEFFPESDPLKSRAKDKALVIMEHLVLINETSGWTSFNKEKVKVQLLEDIDMFLGYLWIGKSQGWLNSVNFLIISNGYEKIKKEIGLAIGPSIEFTQKLPGLNGEVAQAEPKTLPDPILNNIGTKKEEVPISFNLSDRQNPLTREVTARQRKILDFLKSNEKAQVMDLQKILPDITKRTIRRDLDELLEVGKITREGDFNQVVYKLVSLGHSIYR